MMAARWELALGPGKEASPDQRRAIEAPMDGRRCIDAGAGTGKTTTLALRALCLIERGDLLPHELLVVTFTREAAAEIQQRIYNTLQASGLAERIPDGRSVECSTIHALAASLLREFAYDCGFIELPRAVTDGEARAIFHRAFQAMLRGELPVDATLLPLAELLKGGYDFEGDLAQIALDLKNRGIAVDAFEQRALQQAEILRSQTWGQLYEMGARGPKAKAPEPTRTAEQRRIEAAAERANIAAIAALLRRFDDELSKDGAMTYGDLIGRVTAMIEQDPRVAQAVQNRWKYALIDEFQDTSRTQMRFINALLGATPLMPVGDFRQSIYGFNGADPGVMRDFAATATETYPLVVNRRSYHEIVHSAHHVLRARARGLLHDGDTGLDAHKGAGGPEIVRFRTFDTIGGVREQTKEEAQHIAGEIAQLLARGTKATDIAILLRRRTHAQTYVRTLNERGIAVALDRRSGLLDADEVRDAMAWMSLIGNLNDKLAAARVLQSPVIGLCDGTMAAIRASGGKDWLRWLLTADLASALGADTASRIDRFQSLLERLLHAASLPLIEAVRKVLHVCPIAAAYAGGRSSDAAQAIVNLRNLEILAQSFAADNELDGLANFVQWLDDAVTYNDDPPAAELDFDGVRIMTVHQAKGLEWDYVFVACVSDDQYGTTEFGRGSTARIDWRTGALALRMSIDGTTPLRWYMLQAPYDAATGQRIEDAEKLEREREQARVFYVAMTRAKDRLYVTGLAGRSGGDCKFLSALADWAGRQGRPDTPLVSQAGTSATDDGYFPQSDILIQPESTETPEYRQQSVFAPRLSFTAISAFQTCPRQARYRYRLKLPGLAANEPRFVGTTYAPPPGLDGATFGTLVHRAMELWGQAAIDGAAIDGTAAVAAAISEFTDISTADADRARKTVERAIAALNGYVPIAVEEPFELHIAGFRVEGFIDLVALGPDGKLTILDYKTGHVDDKHYIVQLSVYKEAYERMRGMTVTQASLLRLSEDSAAFVSILPVPLSNIESLVIKTAAFSADTPLVGGWCRTCPYRFSPCNAPEA